MGKVVLMYHDIVTEADKSSGFQNKSAFQYKVLASKFEEQVKILEEKDVEFTFDDGGVSFISMAAPILERYRRRGLFFVSTDYIGTDGFLSEEQIQELDRRGHTIGSHSCSHPHNMSQLSSLEIVHEWSDSIKKLETILGHKVSVASIPNGYTSKTVVQCATQCGIKDLYTSTPTISETDKYRIKLHGRYVIHKDMSTEYVAQIVNSKSCRYKLYFRWLILEALKCILGNKYDKVKSKFV